MSRRWWCEKVRETRGEEGQHVDYIEPEPMRRRRSKEEGWWWWW